MNRSHKGCGEEWEGGDVVELSCAWRQRHGEQALRRSMTTLRTGYQGASLRHAEKKTPYVFTLVPHHPTPRKFRKAQLL